MVSDVLKKCVKKGFLLDKEMLELFNNLDEDVYDEIINLMGNLKLNERIITKKIFLKYINYIKENISFDSEKINFFFNSFGKSESEIINKIKTNYKEYKPQQNFKILSAPFFPQRKVVVSDFVNHFKDRFENIRKIIESKNLENLTSLRKIKGNTGNFSFVGAVLNKRITKNKNILLEVEDLTGSANLLINQNKKDVYEKGKDIILDDIIGFNVSVSNNFLYCNDLVYPDSVLKEKRKYDKDEWVVFISDLHSGSKLFLEENFIKFIKWINGKQGNEEHKKIAEKVKYLFITGDLVDGVNHYPGQENDLKILTSVGQYQKVEELLKLIRSDIQIIACPGNHDAVWVGEPQPIISEKWAEGLHKIPNLELVTNPCLVEIDGGFKILMYHGASLNPFIEEIPEIRTKYGKHSPTTVVKEVLKRRHLSPMHGLVDYIPCDKDLLVINPVPDILLTGDLHRCEVSMYNNILLVAGSCWQAQTNFMEKIGVEADPCKAILFNLKTREIKIMDFSDDDKEINWLENPELYCPYDCNFKEEDK